MRNCRICGPTLNEFYKRGNACKACISRDRKDYYKKNKESVKRRVTEYAKNNNKRKREYNKNYYTNNRAKLSEYARNYRKKNTGKIAALSKSYYDKNREQLAAYKKRYRAENADKVKAYNREYHKRYRKLNSDKIRAASSKYRALNQAKILDYQRQYYQNNKKKIHARRHRRYDIEAVYYPEKFKIQDLKRRNRKQSNGGMPPSGKQLACLVQLYRNTCAYCNTNPYGHIDHIVPVALGGSNDIENLVPACASCNLSKNAKPIEQFLDEKRAEIFKKRRAEVSLCLRQSLIDKAS